MSFMRCRRITALQGHASRSVSPLVARYHLSAPTLQEKVAEKEVKVVDYASNGGQKASGTLRVHHLLPVGEHGSSSVDPSDTAPAKFSYGLQKSILAGMPPTLQKFALQDKVCVVTGGARGLGNNIARGFAEVGAKAIALMDVQQELGDAAAAELSEACQVPVSFYKVDVRDETAVTKVVGDIAEKYGRLDVLVNAAGIADSNIKAEDYPIEMFRRLIDVNVTGSFLVAQACGRQMIQAQTGGFIIFIASMSGSIVNYPQEQCCYNASKAAVIQLGKSLAAEWARHGIRVNSISPGYMDTALNRVPALDAQKKIWISMTPQARLGQVDELNGLAVYLASDASSFKTGSNCVIDGGYSVY